MSNARPLGDAVRVARLFTTYRPVTHRQRMAYLKALTRERFASTCKASGVPVRKPKVHAPRPALKGSFATHVMTYDANGKFVGRVGREDIGE